MSAETAIQASCTFLRYNKLERLPESSVFGNIVHEWLPEPCSENLETEDMSKGSVIEKCEVDKPRADM